ncbi:hypothetical protein [Clostridium paraputrificum]|nr:hypothetical protein [Clostridium paraputrificum]
MSNPNLPSGIYKCTTPGCKNEVVHSEGENFAPCGSCDKNNWQLVRKTK